MPPFFSFGESFPSIYICSQVDLFPPKIFSLPSSSVHAFVTVNDENIDNHMVLWFYGYIGDISMDILEKNIDKPKIDQNL